MLGIIGGSGFYNFEKLKNTRYIKSQTELGKASADILIGEITNSDRKVEVAFLARHGLEHNLAPHKINYRANILALKSVGVSRIIGVHSVGAIAKLENTSLVLPTNLIDYTYGRESSFFDGDYLPLKHIDFSQPFCKKMQNKLQEVARENAIELKPTGAYAVTQGIRLETIAEIEKLAKDGASIVGMTLMPEAVLARELEIDYVSLSLVVNAAAGINSKEISIEEIKTNLQKSINKVEDLIFAYSLTI